MNNRNFQEDLGLVMAMFYPGKGDVVKFPMYSTEEFETTNVLELNLSKRAVNICIRNHIDTIGDLIENFPKLEAFRNCGKGTVKELRNSLIAFHYQALSEEKVKRFWREFIELNEYSQGA